MKKFITPIFALLLLSMSFTSYAISKVETISFKAYKNQLRAAFSLYSSSNYEQALPALEIMAEYGEKRAQYIVGTMYLNALGTEQNLLKSYAWLMVANEQKNKQWKKPLQLLQQKLSAHFLQNARLEGDNYIAKYGVHAQHLKCRQVRTLGSKKRTHECRKSEVKKGYYFVSDKLQNERLALNLD